MKNYTLYKDDNKRGFIKFYIGGLSMIIAIFFFLVPGAVIGFVGYQFINTNFTGVLYISLIVIGGILFIILLSILTLLYLFTGLVIKVYLESKVESYFRGWSYWDEQIVEDLKKKEIDIENIEYNENGVFIEINEENFF